jgi:predicted HAD superfamily Cof-like phosphohydrolase
MSLESHLTTVRTFHQLIGELVVSQPSLLPGDRNQADEMASELRKISKRFSELADNKLVTRAAMAVEELAEWLESHIRDDLVEATDALADRLFVLIGDAASSGLPIEAAFEIVARSNATKLASKRSLSGKAIKSDEYQCPKKKIAQLLGVVR